MQFARHNVAVCAPTAQAGFVCADVTQLPLPLSGSTPSSSTRLAGTSDGRLPAGRYQPPLGWCLRLAGAVPRVGIKAAPGLKRDLVPPGWETEFVAVGRELKEAMLWSPALAAGGVTSRATDTAGGVTR